MSQRLLKVRLILRAEPSGGFVVTSPDVPELVTEGASVREAVDNAHDAFEAVWELWEEQGKAIADIDGVEFEPMVILP